MGKCALYNKDEFACLKCPYDKCIKDRDTRKKEFKINNKPRKKFTPEEEKQRRTEQSRQWYKDNPDRAKYHSRKSMRERRIKEGTATSCGFAMIDGTKTAMYEGKCHFRYYCLINDEYKEFTVNQMIGKWIHSEVV